jgi:hypothetical protein
MGQSQLLIIAISVLVIGIAIAAGAGVFSADDIEINKKAMINDVNHIATNAVRYYRRIAALGGGGYNYMGYALPIGFRSNLNGTYSTTPLTKDILQVTGISARDSTDTMVAQIDTYGKASNWTFTGDFE